MRIEGIHQILDSELFDLPSEKIRFGISIRDDPEFSFKCVSTTIFSEIWDDYSISIQSLTRNPVFQMDVFQGIAP